MWAKIVLVTIFTTIVVVLSLFYATEWEETTIIETEEQEINLDSEPDSIVTTAASKTYTVRLESGDYLECLHANRIDCRSPKSRKVISHRKYHSKSGVLKETKVSVRVNKKYNQPVIYYMYSSTKVYSLSLFCSILCLLLL